MDKKAKLTEVRNALKAFVNRDELTEDEVKKMDELNKEAVKLQGQIAADDQLAKHEEEEKERIENEKREAVEAARKEEAAKYRRLGEAPYQAKHSDAWKYDNMDGTDLSLLLDVAPRMGIQLDRAAALKAMADRVVEMKPADNSEEARKDVAYVKAAFKAATGIDPKAENLEAAFKAATDPMYSGGSGIGSDWVGTAYSTELWRAIRAATPVAANVPSDVIPDGYSSKIWPLESTDPTWYKVAEATASDSTLKVPAATITASQATTTSKTISVAKLGARVLYTGELVEDSLVAFVPTLRSQLQSSGAEIVESLFIDGDVETSANKNVNDIAGTPAAGDYFLMFDGFRKLALVTNTANSRSASGGLAIEDYIETLKLMGTAGLAGSDPSKVAFIVDGNVHYANMKLPEVKSRDVYSAATVENGFLRQAFGVPIIPSWQMHRAASDRKANTSGKVDVDTTTNNTTGAILAVRWDQWKQAYKRRMSMEVTRIANADSYEIVCIARLGLAYRDNEASAISYNVGV